MAMSVAKTNAAEESQCLDRQCRSVLDGRRLSISVPVSAAKNLTESSRRTPFMKQLIVIFSASLLVLPLFGQEKSTQLKDQKDKVSYSVGLQIGFNLSRQKVDINPDILAAGIKDALAGKPQLNPDQMKEVMTTFEKDMEQKQKEAGDKNKTEGAKFLEENKKKEGVKTTGSGLQYKVVKEGNGAQPKATDTVTVNYRGTLINGTEFDSSYKRGQPATFPVNGVIKGWTEALQLMKVGSKYQLFIPSSLAYGERAVSPDLSANSTLIFEVELLDAKPAPTPAAPGAAAPKGAPSPATSPSPKK
jgi:FKBP-type peptidyl-prolyl cis-trans isomerase FklB